MSMENVVVENRSRGLLKHESMKLFDTYLLSIIITPSRESLFKFIQK
jgi:hypothetical protein